MNNGDSDLVIRKNGRVLFVAAFAQLLEGSETLCLLSHTKSNGGVKQVESVHKLAKPRAKIACPWWTFTVRLIVKGV